MKHKILVLGSRGYIGRNLNKFLDSRADIYSHPRGAEAVSENLARTRPNVIINSSASGLNDSFEDSINANFLYQTEFLKYAMTSEMRLTWIQLSSYYELQIPMGRSDFYSKSKDVFRKLLYDLNEKGLIDVKNVFLPHVFGLDERPSRLIPSIRKVQINNSKVEFSNGMQFVPILHVSDACNAIWSAINSNLVDTSATPIWYGRIQELVGSLLKPSLRQLVEFNSIKVEVDDSFPKVNFPTAVPGWNANYLFENLLQDFKTKN